MRKRTGRKPKRERTSRRRTRRHSSTSETSSEDVPPKTRASSRVNEAERKVALTIKLPKPEGNECSEENSTGMWKVECSNGSDGDIQKLKISLRRSPKDLLREQAAEAKYSADRKAAEVAGSSSNTSALDGSVTNYLEQFGSSVAVEESESIIAASHEQVQVVIPTNEPSCNEDNIVKIENDHIDSGGMPKFISTQEETIVENATSDNKFVDGIVSETIIETNEINENIKDPITIAVESITSSEEFPDTRACLPFEECVVSDDKSVRVAEVVSPYLDIPITLSKKTQDIDPESVVSVINNSNTSEVIEEVKVPAVEINKSAHEDNKDPIKTNKADVINDSEQMEDVVQLTVESPDLVDDEDPKPIYEEDPKSVCEESKLVAEEPKLVVEEELKLVDKEIKPVEECYSTQLSDIPHLKHVDVETEHQKLDETSSSVETPTSYSLHPKRKWGSCKTRTLITVSPFTLGTLIESNGDSIGGNGEYRSEGEIQRTDSDEEPDVEEAMEVNDTLLIDHEAVDYEAPEEEEERPNIDNDSKSDKSLSEEINDVEPKKKSSKRMLSTSVIRITNLVRPFTVGQLRDLLQRTGKIVSNGFWIDAIKSQCIVEYENEDQAIETVYALNESQWPSTNPKFLRVVFTDKEELNKALNGTHPDRLIKQKESKVEKLRTKVENHIILREWDRGKLEDVNGEKEDKPIKRKTSDDPHLLKDKKVKKDDKDVLDKRRKSKSKTPERIPSKCLDELFRKTKTTPTLYWSPLSTEQITEKENQRRKHLAEMERSQKTVSRRRDNNHYPRRR